jgi:hypothetical protein
VGEAVGDGEALRSVVSSPLEGAGVVPEVVGSVRWVVCRGGSYGPLSATDIVIATTTAISVTSGASATTSGTRTDGRTHPSKMYHNNPAKTKVSTAADAHNACPDIGATYPPNILRHQVRSSERSSCSCLRASINSIWNRRGIHPCARISVCS